MPYFTDAHGGGQVWVQARAVMCAKADETQIRTQLMLGGNGQGGVLAVLVEGSLLSVTRDLRDELFGMPYPTAPGN